MYARFFDGSNLKIALTEGVGASLRVYSASDAAIDATGLAAGTYYPAAYLGSAAAPLDTDQLIWVFDSFVFGATTETPFAQQVAAYSAINNVTQEVKSIQVTLGAV